MENTRTIPDSAVCDEDEEVLDEERIDEFASYFVEGQTPKGDLFFSNSFVRFFSSNLAPLLFRQHFDFLSDRDHITQCFEACQEVRE